MLRIHFLLQWYALSDPAVEEALYDSQAMGWFVGIDMGREGAPDKTTISKFRHLPEKHALAAKVFAAVGGQLKKHAAEVAVPECLDGRCPLDAAAFSYFIYKMSNY